MNRVSVWPGSTVDNTISEFNDIARKIADLPFSECVVEFLMQDGFRITLTFDNGKMLLLNFPVFAMKEGIVVYSFFIYRELIACDYCKTEDFISGFNKYL